MSIAVGTAVSGNATASTLTVSLTMPAGANGCVYLFGIFASTPQAAGASATYNGVAATKIKTDGNFVAWRVDAPAAGAHNAVFTPNSSSFVTGIAVPVTGAKQGVQFDNYALVNVSTTASTALPLTPVAPGCAVLAQASGANPNTWDAGGITGTSVAANVNSAQFNYLHSSTAPITGAIDWVGQNTIIAALPIHVHLFSVEPAPSGGPRLAVMGVGR